MGQGDDARVNTHGRATCATVVMEAARCRQRLTRYARHAIRGKRLLARMALLLLATWCAQADAIQIPTASTGGTLASDTSVTKTYPSGLTYTLTLSGGNGIPFMFDGQGGLNEAGAATTDYYMPAMDVAALNSASRMRVYGPCTPSGGVCLNRGTLTIAFNQPVTNPILHVAGLGGSSSGTSHAPAFRLISPSAGARLINASFASSNMNVTSTSFSSNALNGESDCNVSSTGAGCGSIEIRGTVTSVTFAVDLRSEGNLTSAHFDTFSMSITVDEDFGDAPVTGFNSAQAPSHILGDLRLGASIDADGIYEMAATTSPVAVGAGTDNTGSRGDGDDEDAITSFPVLTTAHASYSLAVPISGASKAGMACGWIDFNRNNAFVASERACTSFAAGATSVTLVWNSGNGNAPGGLSVGNNYVRLRAGYTSAQIQTADGKGRADSGEVEDYRMAITTAPTLTLAKTWSGAAVGNVAWLDAEGTNGAISFDSVADSANETDTNTPWAVMPGGSYTIEESIAVGVSAAYEKALSCTGNTGTGAALSYTPNATSGTLTVGSTATAIVCTFTNTRRVADVRIEKTANPSPVVANTNVQFTLVISNLGPSAADGAVVRDPAAAGLDCTAAGLPVMTCSAASGASCPGSLTVAGLQSPGLTIPALPNGGAVTLGLTCRATASGLP